MPYETVDEKVVQRRRIRVCSRCRCEMLDVANRSNYHMAGSLTGSLGGSMGASALAGAVLGPVGAIGGAIAGAIMGSKAGVKASDKVAEAVENKADSYCQSCREILYVDNPNPDIGSARATKPSHH